MGLQVLWSMGLACLDVYALRIKRDLHNPVLVSLFVVGDWVTKFHSLPSMALCRGLNDLFIAWSTCLPEIRQELRGNFHAYHFLTVDVVSSHDEFHLYSITLET